MLHKNKEYVFLNIQTDTFISQIINHVKKTQVTM